MIHMPRGDCESLGSHVVEQQEESRRIDTTRRGHEDVAGLDPLSQKKTPDNVDHGPLVYRRATVVDVFASLATMLLALGSWL